MATNYINLYETNKYILFLLIDTNTNKLSCLFAL